MFRSIISPILRSTRHTSAPEDGRNYRPKHVELIEVINKLLLLHLVGCLYCYNIVEPDCLAPISFFKFHIKYENKLHVLEFYYNNIYLKIFCLSVNYIKTKDKNFLVGTEIP